MKSFTRIGLPILVVIAAVFGITFVRVYSPDDPGAADGPKPARAGKVAAKDLPLKMGLTPVGPVSLKPEPWQQSLTYWNPEFELGVPGHFEFWCQNPHREPVTIRVYDAYCQCAGLDVAAVPPDAFKEYAVESALAGGPLCPAPAPLAAFAHVALGRRLTWAAAQESYGDRHDQTIPGADPAAGTQVAILRLGWKANGEPGQKNAWAKLLASIGDAPGAQYTLEANSVAVPSFDLVRREGPDAWAPVPDLSVGDLRENGEARRVLYLLSTTRRDVVYRVSINHPDPCVTWTEPVPASAEEVRSLSDFFNQPGRPVRRLKSVYRFEVSVRERTESEAGGKKQFHQLDLGLLDRRLTVSAVDGGSHQVALKARVLGEIDFLSGAKDGRVDLGSAFPADQDWTKDVVLVADRPGLDLALAAAETTPNYLKVRLEPLKPIEGRNQWRLRVTVPRGSLYGALPETSAVVLTTTGPNPRRLRIPVRGMTYDSGGPRI